VLYKIVPKKPIASIIDAESPDSAIDAFAWSMDDDMNIYFEAVPATDAETKEFEESKQSFATHLRICSVCGRPVYAGMTNADGSFYVHEECFETYMNETYGAWFEVDDDGCGGYYMGCEREEPIGPYATGIFYTEWEDEEFEE